MVFQVTFNLTLVEFAGYIHYCKSLRFEDRPDYGYLRRSFKDLMAREGMEYDCIFDWTASDVPKKQYSQDNKSGKRTFNIMNRKYPWRFNSGKSKYTKR